MPESRYHEDDEGDPRYHLPPGQPRLTAERLAKPDIKRDTIKRDAHGLVTYCETAQNPCLDELLRRRIITEDQHACGVDLSIMATIARAYLGYRGSRSDPQLTDRTGIAPADFPAVTDKFNRLMRALIRHWATLEDVCIENRLRVCLVSCRHVVEEAFEALEREMGR